MNFCGSEGTAVLDSLNSEFTAIVGFVLITALALQKMGC